MYLHRKTYRRHEHPIAKINHQEEFLDRESGQVPLRIEKLEMNICYGPNRRSVRLIVVLQLDLLWCAPDEISFSTSNPAL
jgi:hypothetical protein